MRATEEQAIELLKSRVSEDDIAAIYRFKEDFFVQAGTSFGQKDIVKAATAERETLAMYRVLVGILGWDNYLADLECSLPDRKYREVKRIVNNAYNALITRAKEDLVVSVDVEDVMVISYGNTTIRFDKPTTIRYSCG